MDTPDTAPSETDTNKQKPSKRGVTPTKLRIEARKMAGEALEALGALMKGDGQAAVRLSAAREILDRGYGRPKLGEAETTSDGGFTVVVKRFTDPPAPKALPPAEDPA